MMRYDGNGDVAWNDDIYNQGFDDIYNQGFDDGRTQILTDLALIYKENDYEAALKIAVQDYLEDNGFI